MSDAKPPTAEAAASTVDCESLTWEQTRSLIRSDFVRLVAWYRGGPLFKRIYWFFQPNFQAIFLFRLYRYLYVNDWHKLARFLFSCSLYLTGVEIPPTTSIGPACLINHAFGIVLFGRFGARLSLYGQGGTGGGVGPSIDLGGGPGYPVVGDDVVFGIKALALGAIRIGDRAQLGPAALVTCDVPADAMVVTIPSKVIKVQMRAPDEAGSVLSGGMSAFDDEGTGEVTGVRMGEGTGTVVGTGDMTPAVEKSTSDATRIPPPQTPEMTPIRRVL
jgi:serine O-acetyltransferase